MTTRGYWAVFLVSSALCGCVFWWQADWWAYTDFPEGPRAEFEMPWWYQLPVSIIVGCVGGVVTILVAWFVAWAWSRRTRRI